jgi:DNA topoisomerase VI subunit B
LIVSQQSAAEFFSEHQQIAGFDNAGKALFTTIREFVENSLDASESIHVLPEINLSIVEYTEKEHNIKNGIDRGNNSDDDDDDNHDNDLSLKSKKKSLDGNKKSSIKEKFEKGTMYYQIICKDNGCGIPAESIGEMLGKVLSGSKHGIRQTRGKFGLGAKMVINIYLFYIK